MSKEKDVWMCSICGDEGDNTFIDAWRRVSDSELPDDSINQIMHTEKGFAIDGKIKSKITAYVRARSSYDAFLEILKIKNQYLKDEKTF